jgi:hypothetical protein
MTDSNQLAVDILTTAVESGYPWFLYTRIVRDDYGVACAVLVVDESCEGDPDPDATEFEIKPSDVMKAIRKYAESGTPDNPLKRTARDIVFHPEDADYDVNDADGFLQLAVLGEIVYA